MLGILAACVATAAHGQMPEPPPPGFEDAGVVEKPNAQVPLNVEFQDETGKTVRLGDFFHRDRPVLLMMIYFRCPMLCNLTLNGVVKALKDVALVPGRDFDIVTVGFDPREGRELAAAKKANYLKALGKPEAESAWHFLTSSNPAAARAVGDAIGFGYKLDPKGENYLHQSAIYLCTPDGRVSRTIQGVEFESAVLQDSLVNASEGRISQGLFGVAMSCGLVHFDPDTGKYTWAAVAIMRITGISTMLVVAVVIGMLVYRDTQRRKK